MDFQLEHRCTVSTPVLIPGGEACPSGSRQPYLSQPHNDGHVPAAGFSRQQEEQTIISKAQCGMKKAWFH